MSKKFFGVIYIFICLFFSPLAIGNTIKAGISYTTDRARIEAFDGVLTKIDMLKYQHAFQDSQMDENLKFINRGKLVLRDRYISIFANGNYAVIYKNEQNTAYYYSKSGNLRFIEFNETGNYPRKGAKYDLMGNLDGTSISITHDNQYIFDANKKLTAHWIGDNCYDENGILFDTRK